MSVYCGFRLAVECHGPTVERGWNETEVRRRRGRHDFTQVQVSRRGSLLPAQSTIMRVRTRYRLQGIGCVESCPKAVSVRPYIDDQTRAYKAESTINLDLNGSDRPASSPSRIARTPSSPRRLLSLRVKIPPYASKHWAVRPSPSLATFWAVPMIRLYGPAKDTLFAVPSTVAPGKN